MNDEIQSYADHIIMQNKNIIMLMSRMFQMVACYWVEERKFVLLAKYIFLFYYNNKCIMSQTKTFDRGGWVDKFDA